MTADEQQANYERLQEGLRQRKAAGYTGAVDLSQLSTPLESQNKAAAVGAVEGAKEGLENVLAAPGKVVEITGQGLTKVVGGILGGVPWWVWIVSGVILFFYMGGNIFLRGSLKRFE